MSINLRKKPRGILSYWLGTAIGDSLDGFATSEGSSVIFELFETAKTVDLLSQKKSSELLLIVCLFGLCSSGSKKIRLEQGG